MNIRRALRFARVEFYLCRWHGYGIAEAAQSALAVLIDQVQK